MQHLAMIMDGNRRWARKMGFKTVYHRQEGVDSVQTAARFCIKNNIPYLTLYMLSIENTSNRAQEFLDHIFKLMLKTIRDDGQQLVDQGIRVRFIGQRDMYPAHLLEDINAIEERTKDGAKLTMHLMFYYGARQELTDAARRIATKVKNGELNPEDITQDTLAQNLWTAGVPNPDLLVRTGGKDTIRLSNFLLYQAAYTELQFKDYFWPELTEEKLQDCLDEFNGVTRNYGA